MDEKKATCPNCGSGTHGTDSLCDDCYNEYLGTHAGSRDNSPCGCKFCKHLPLIEPEMTEAEALAGVEFIDNFVTDCVGKVVGEGFVLFDVYVDDYEDMMELEDKLKNEERIKGAYITHDTSFDYYVVQIYFYD